MHTYVEVDFVETEVETNVEAAVIVGDEAGQKVDVEKQSTKMSGSFAFSLWMWHGFLVKVVANVSTIVLEPHDLFCGSHFRNAIHYLGL